MTHLLRELRNTEDLEDVKQIQFSLFSHQDIKRGSVADILTLILMMEIFQKTMDYLTIIWVP